MLRFTMAPSRKLYSSEHLPREGEQIPTEEQQKESRRNIYTDGLSGISAQIRCRALDLGGYDFKTII